MTDAEFMECVCDGCKIDGGIVCSATQSKLVAYKWKCNKGKLTRHEALERKKRIEEQWNKNFV